MRGLPEQVADRPALLRLVGVWRLVLVGTALANASGACREDRSSGRTLTIDTMPGGTVVVRNTGRGLWDSSTAWRLVEELRVGSATANGPDSFNEIAALSIDGRGRLYVLERQAQEIRVFDSAGKFVRTIGRKGAGPGEFLEAIGMDWDRAGGLWVVDQRNARYSVFDTAGRLQKEGPRPFSGFFTATWRGGIDTTGRLYEWYSAFGKPNRAALLRLDSALRIHDTLPLPAYEEEAFRIERPSMRVSARVPFTPSLVWTFDRRGFVWFGTTVPYRVYQRRLDGDTIRVVERPFEAAPVTAEERDSALATYKWFTDQGGKVDPARVPATKPAFSRLVVDDGGNLWVIPVVREARSNRLSFDLFDREGRYLGRLQAPFAVRPIDPLVVQRSKLYAVVRGDDDVPYVLRARIAKEKPH